MRRGHQVTVVCARFPGTRSGSVNGVRVVRVPVLRRRPLERLSFVAALSALLLAWLPRFDLMHIHLAGEHTDSAVLLGRLWRRPVYVKVAAGGAGGDIAQQLSVPGLPRYLGLRLADRVQALSDEIAGELSGIGIAPARQVSIPNGLPLSEFTPATALDRAEARARLGLPLGEPIVLYVGRVTRLKGVFDLLDVWRGPAPPDATLLLLGEVSPSTARELGPLPSRVLQRGFSRDVASYYRAADVFVLPSHYEGMSNALLEAMASGLPIVATRVGAAEAMIAHGRDGLLVPARDVDALGGALRRVLSDAQLQQALGSAAARAARDYSVESVVDRVLAVYEELLAERRPRGRLAGSAG